MAFIYLYCIYYILIVILQSYSGEGGMITYNSMKGSMDIKRLRNLVLNEPDCDDGECRV